MGTIAGWLLLALAAFMLVGFFNADVSGPSAIIALVITVLLPAAGGIMLIRRGGGLPGRSLGARRDELRRETMQSELLRLAQQHNGRLTIVESVAALGITPDEAKEALDALALRDIAEHEVTDSGVIVYVFRDVQRIDEKHRSKGLLE